jgi:3-dehydroquinate dehydratase/shikimate dehydrogenase
MEPDRAATRIVASVPVATRAEAAAVRDALAAERRDGADACDLVELRADGWREGRDDLADAIRGLPLPAIATVRARSEGGTFAGSEAERRALLLAASRVARFVDVEAAAPFAAERFAPAQKIVSRHDLAATPADLEAAFRELLARAPDAALAKLAVTPVASADVARLAAFARGSGGGGGPPRALVAMGDAGRALRALAGKLGSALAYGSLPSHAATAPGQWSVRELAWQFGVREQTAATPVLAVVGRPIGHSLSPLLHGRLLRAAGLPHVFVPLLADRLDDALALAPTLDLRGLSVTLPFKRDALRAARGAAAGFPWPPPEGAVNTLLRDDRGWLAANTDRIGFAAALATRAPPSSWHGRSVLVVGAGGAARTCVAVLSELGAVVTVAGRTPERAEELAAAFRARGVALDREAVDAAPSFDLIVNATPVGMHPDVAASPLEGAAFRRGQTVFDLIYRPRATRLLQDAARAGADALEGLEMFLAQALAQFRLFTGREPDAALARATLLDALAS